MEIVMKKCIKIFITFVCVIGFYIGSAGFNQIEATTKVPDNHSIEQLKVEWRKDLAHGYTIDVGDRKGTLLIRVDQPKTETNVEWTNWKIRNNVSVSFQMNSDLKDFYNINSKIIAFSSLTMYDYRLGGGYMKFSDFSDPYFYAGLAVYISKKYNSEGIYWFGGNSYALREKGQVKAYFFHDVDVVEESLKRVKKDGTFPLMNKVMWGKTELWNGQLGKVTIKKTETLWKLLDNGQLEKVRDLKQGDEFRVYRYLDEEELYGVGSGMYVKNNPSEIIYETPSKRNLRLISIINGEE